MPTDAQGGVGRSLCSNSSASLAGCGLLTWLSMTCNSLDFSTAFLNRELGDNEQVYVRIQAALACGRSGLRQANALYGLKLAVKGWHAKRHTELAGIEVTESERRRHVRWSRGRSPAPSTSRTLGTQRTSSRWDGMCTVTGIMGSFKCDYKQVTSVFVIMSVLMSSVLTPTA